MSGLDDTAEKLLRTLQACGEGWHSRAELAELLGKRKLNPVETAALDVLAEKEVIERRAQPLNSTLINRWEYRVKEGKA